MVSLNQDVDSKIQRCLFEQACGFNFFKAVHLLESLSGGFPPGTGLRPAQDPVRFRVLPGFVFPASDIQRIEPDSNGRRPQMVVNFMGLIGPKGVLPDWYNEHAYNLVLKKEFAFTDFLDLFHHRLISLFYLAWKKYRLAENYLPDCSDPISSILSSLTGMGEREQGSDSDFFSTTKRRLIHFCGLVSRTVPSVAAIETIVAHATGAAVRIEQFVERMIDIHEQDRTCLGRNNSTLKKDALCGGRVRDVESFFRIEIGPLPWKQYLTFAPRSRNLELIRKLITYLAGIEYEFEMRLILLGRDIPALGLGSRIQAPILGRTVLLRRPHKPCTQDVPLKATAAQSSTQTF